jgi:hypothetical protein
MLHLLGRLASIVIDSVFHKTKEHNEVNLNSEQLI